MWLLFDLILTRVCHRPFCSVSSTNPVNSPTGTPRSIDVGLGERVPWSWCSCDSPNAFRFLLTRACPRTFCYSHAGLVSHTQSLRRFCLDRAWTFFLGSLLRPSGSSPQHRKVGLARTLVLRAVLVRRRCVAVSWALLLLTRCVFGLGFTGRVVVLICLAQTSTPCGQSWLALLLSR